MKTCIPFRNLSSKSITNNFSSKVMPPKKVRTPIKSAAQPLIRSWDGRSADAATLRVIVENGVVAGMQPKEIMKAYPCFQKYEGSTFRSALTNIRNSVNKAISNRASYCNTELPAKSSFRNQSRNKFNDDDYDDDDDDDDYEDESVGGSNEDDEYDQMTYNSFSASTLGYKSVKFVEGRKSISSSGKKSQKDSAAVTHGPTSITLPYVLDVWDAKDASKHISLQIQLLSGMTEKSVYARVSSDKKAVVLTFPMSDYLAKADIALINYVGPLNPGSNGILEYHPKVIARAKSVSVIRNRDSTKVVTYEQRIPLPHECFHEWATEKSDPFFHGAHFVKYPDNSCHLHVEMIIDRGDKYMIEPEKLINRIIIGTNVHVPYENEEASHADDGNNTVFSMQGVQHYKADLESISSFRATLPGSIVAIPPVPDSPDSVKESPNGFHVTRSQKRQAIVLKKSGNPKSVA